MRGISKRYMIFGLLLLVIASAGCTGGSPSQEATVQESPATQATTAPVTTAAPTTAPAPTTTAVDEMSALEQMEIAFEGGYTKGGIKERLDVAIELYGLPITEENYQRAGSTLVALRKANGVTEMDILECMIQTHVPEVNITFPEAAALCSATLASQ